MKTMKLIVFFASIVFCLLCNEVSSNETSSEQCSASDDEIRNYHQLRGNAYVISGLEDHLVKLKAKLGKLSSAPSLRKIYSDIAFRVGRLEGTGCNVNQMQCGGNSRQCVSEMLACDGVKDCKNGKDEDQVFCNPPALKPSTVYKATVQMGACFGGGKTSYKFRNKIRTFHRSKIFPSRVTFTEYVQAYIGGQLGMSVVARGEYQSGTRRYRSYLPESGNLWSECFIPEEDTERFYCSSFKGMVYLPCVRHFVADLVKP